MKEVTGKSFGLLIAYVLPGTVTLIGLSRFSPTLQSWLNGPSEPAPTVGGFLYVTLAAVGAGMTLSAVRWALIDSLFASFGLTRPQWDDSRLAERLEAFEALVENHYRYYQFHSGMLVAVPFSYLVCRRELTQPRWPWDLAVLALTLIFLLTSRDELSKYYRRGLLLLGPLPKETDVSNGHIYHESAPPVQKAKPAKANTPRKETTHKPVEPKK